MQAIPKRVCAPDCYVLMHVSVGISSAIDIHKLLQFSLKPHLGGGGLGGGGLGGGLGGGGLRHKTEKFKLGNNICLSCTTAT